MSDPQLPAASTAPLANVLRPSYVSTRLLAALDASEGRRRRRKRDTTPDSIGMAIKRSLLEQSVVDDPDPDEFEQWLLQRCLSSPDASGPARAIALEILFDWRQAQMSIPFRHWLEQGAPSEDASP